MSERRRVLLLSPFPPRLDATHGGSRSVAHLVHALSARNRVALAYLGTDDEPPIDPEVAAVCEIVQGVRRSGTSRSSVRPWPRAVRVLPTLLTGRPLWVAARWNRQLAARVRELSREWRPHVVQAEFSAMGQYLQPATPRGAGRFVTIHEPGAATPLERGRNAAPLARPVWRIASRLWLHYERDLLRSTDATIVFTERDRQSMLRLCPTARIETIPLGIAMPRSASDPLGEDPPALLFVGNFVHRPNLQAATWLVEQLFPRLRSRFPGLRLWIVGDNATDALRKAAFPGVTVTGRVPDVSSYLDRAAMVVTPLTSGGGMRVKVLEALAAGKAVVSSPLAIEGLQIQSGTHALVASDLEEYVGAVAGLVEDPAARAALGAAGRAWAQENLSWDRCAERYEELWDSVLRDRQTSPLAREAV